MKRTLVTTVLTTLGLGFTLNAQPGPRWAAANDNTDEVRGPGRQGPPPWAMRGGPAGRGPLATRPDASPEAALEADQPEVTPDRQGPPPWAGRGAQNQANRQGPPPWVNRGQGGQGPRAFAGPGAGQGQMLREMLRNRLQNAPRVGANRQGPPPWVAPGGQGGLNRQGPPPWVARGGQFGTGRQAPPAWANRGPGGQGRGAFSAPGAGRGQMLRQMLRNRLQAAPQGGPRMQQGTCPMCGCECGQGAMMQRRGGAGRPGAEAAPGVQVGPRGPRGPMGLGSGRGPGAGMGPQADPANPEVNAPRRRAQEQSDRPTVEPRGERAPRPQAPARGDRPPRGEREDAE